MRRRRPPQTLLPGQPKISRPSIPDLKQKGIAMAPRTEPQHHSEAISSQERETIASVVVCEDDATTLELLCDNLVAARFGVLPAPSAADALRLCRDEEPDLMLLDLTLPDASGLDVLREIREVNRVASGIDPDLPVIVLSGRGASEERMRGLEFGADDYLVKPFHCGELLARMTSVMRRVKERRSGSLRVGDIVVDPGRRRAWVGGREVLLTKKEFSLLLVLAGDPRRVFSKRELLGEVWGFRASTKTRTLDSHASRLRRKLDPEGNRFVINCWGVGYRLWEGPPAAGSLDQEREVELAPTADPSVSVAHCLDRDPEQDGVSLDAEDALDRIAAYINEPGECQGADFVQFVSQLLPQTGRDVSDA